MVASTVFERRLYFMKAGMATAAWMPMIATTIISSIRVKPRAAVLLSFLIIVSSSSSGSLVLVLRHRRGVVERGHERGVVHVGGLVVAARAQVVPGDRRCGGAEQRLAVGAGQPP